jgi:Domain of unknown function (DUF4384)
MFSRAVLFIGITALATLTSCAPNTLRTRVGGQDIIKEFKVSPAKAQIKLNEYVKFSFTLSKPGFVTLFTIDPDRTTYELDRNIKVAAGKSELPSKNDSDANGGKAAYQISEPIGKQLVYLAFTEKPIPAEVKFKGVLDEAALEKRIREALEKSGGAKDVASLEFEVIK